MTEELYRKYRPQTFKDVVGQDDAVAMLVDMGKRKAIPHCLLFTGPSGCGKTTLARIMRMKMKCGDSDYQELNTADFRGIDMVREIRNRMRLAPMSGKIRMWLVDECHQLSRDAMHAFLKMLEDPPNHVYFMLATTDPQKLLPTIRTRATEVKCRALKTKEMGELLSRTYEAECGVGLNEDVCDKIVSMADGSPRKALVLLGQVIGIDDPEKALASLSGGIAEQEAIDLARLLMQPRCSWLDVAKLLKAIEGLDAQAEGIRRVVLGYMSTVALGGGKGSAKAVDVIKCFRDDYFVSGKAGLIDSCWDAVHPAQD